MFYYSKGRIHHKISVIAVCFIGFYIVNNKTALQMTESNECRVCNWVLGISSIYSIHCEEKAIT